MLACFICCDVSAQDNSWRDLKFQHITQEDGLSQNGVSDILQDRRGFLWFATRDGLNRYDGRRFKIYRRRFGDANSLIDNHLTTLAEDQDGMIWVGGTAGLTRLDPDTGTLTRFRHDQDDPRSLSNNSISAIFVDRDNQIWVGTYRGFNRFNREGEDFTRFYDQASEERGPLLVNAISQTDGVPGIWLATEQGLLHHEKSRSRLLLPFGTDPERLNSVYGLSSGLDNDLWMGSPHGLLHFDLSAEHFSLVEIKGNPPLPQIFDTLLDSRGLIWLASREGLYYYNPKSKTIAHQIQHNERPRGLSGNEITTVFEDRGGIVWVGTFNNGVNKFNRASEIIAHVMREPEHARGYNINTVFAFYEDKLGRIWFGGMSGGLTRFDRKTWKMEHYLSDPDDEQTLSNETVWALAGGEAQQLWAATSGGLNRFSITDGRVKRYYYGSAAPDYGLHNAFLDVDLDRDGNLWLAGYLGLMRFEPDTESWHFFEPGNKGFAASDQPNAVLADEDGTIWLGTANNGLYHWEGKKDRAVNYPADPENPTALAHGNINCLYKDSRGRLWLGTNGGGLNLMVDPAGRFARYTRADGLINERIFGIVEDHLGFLWLGSNGGLIRFEPETGKVKNLDLVYNLQDNGFTKGSAAVTRDGTVLMGGFSGFNMFQPTDIKDYRFNPPLVLTGLKILNKPAGLARDIDALARLNLSHQDRAITFQFVALDYMNPAANQYEYRLEGMDKDWIPLGHAGELTFPSLPPGSYTLRVKGTNHQGFWSEHQVALPIVVDYPPWRHPLAWLAYGLLLVSAVIWYLRAQKKKLRHQEQLNRRLRQVDRLKDEFLANTSHELRTPLHGIIGLAESMREGVAGDLPHEALDNLSLIIASGRRLSTLVSDIMDFATIKEKNLKLNLGVVDAYSLAQVTVSLIKPLIGEKPVVITNQISMDLPPVLADENRLEQILHNLLGNAVKFTEKGHIVLKARQEGNEVVISVVDTGIGVPTDKQEQIFKGFEQGDGTMTREYGGTGLGLAITRRLVELHQGRIWINSEPGKGSDFSFSLRLADRDAAVSTFKPEKSTDNMTPLLAEVEAEESTFSPDTVADWHARILIVDDDAINLRVLDNHLSPQGYEVVCAGGGLEALTSMEEHGPFDLVLLDVMMPKMNGFEVCKQLRIQYPLNELPVIFLTARTQLNDLVAGFQLGGNDYLTKPIARAELLSRVKTHLRLGHISRNLETLVASRTQHLVAAQERLLRDAHSAGMAEIAGQVMHNMGNQLNSLSTTLAVLLETAEDTVSQELLEKIAGLLDEHQHQLGTFFDKDPRAGHVPAAIERIACRLKKNNERVDQEGTLLKELMDELRSMILAQQAFASQELVTRFVEINEVLSENLTTARYSLEAGDVQVTCEFADGLPPVRIEERRFQHMMLCLFQNAMDAIVEKDPDDGGKITLSTWDAGDRVAIEMKDNGIGVEADNQLKIFTQGFTTKQDHRGFGLHYCANTIQAMDGDMEVRSEGLGKGTRVILYFPKKPEE